MKVIVVDGASKNHITFTRKRVPRGQLLLGLPTRFFDAPDIIGRLMCAPELCKYSPIILSQAILMSRCLSRFLREVVMSHTVVVGGLDMDLVVELPTIPRPGETVLGENSATVPGGKGANQAVAMERSGAKGSLIGRVDEGLPTCILALSK